MRRHPVHTLEILSRVSCFRAAASDAASHHERLDGRGYHRDLAGSELSRHARDAVRRPTSATRCSARVPIAPGCPPDRVLDIMGSQVLTALDPDCFAAIRTVLRESPPVDSTEVPAARIVPALLDDYQQAA